MSTISIAVFASGGGTNLQALIDASNAGIFDGRIVAVISNNSGAYALDRARAAHIDACHISSKAIPDEMRFVDALSHVLSSHSANLIVLAGYMKMMPIAILRAYRDRVINIHPALLPKHGGKGMFGLNVHKAVLDAGETVSGATVHFVDEVYDHGPILIQRTVSVLPDDTPESLAARVLVIEHEILPQAVGMFS